MLDVEFISKPSWLGIKMELFCWKILLENKTKQTKVVLKHSKSMMCRQVFAHIIDILSNIFTVYIFFRVCQHYRAKNINWKIWEICLRSFLFYCFSLEDTREKYCKQLTDLQLEGAPLADEEWHWVPPSRSWRCTCTDPRHSPGRPLAATCGPCCGSWCCMTPAVASYCWHGTSCNDERVNLTCCSAGL